MRTSLRTSGLIILATMNRTQAQQSEDEFENCNLKAERSRDAIKAKWIGLRGQPFGRQHFSAVGRADIQKTEKPDILSDIRLHNTGNNLLSHDSGVVLPSAAESLTSVFEMGTCVSSRLWSPESFCSRCLGSLSAAFQIFSMSRFLTQFNSYFQIAW